jgi:catechol 2,3-dioxygenase-like lactoylglutathione lyase family enzyme
MKLKRVDHIGIIVNDLDAAVAFFLEFGLEVMGGAEFEGEWLGRIVGFDHAKTAFVMMRMPDGGANLEIIKFIAPADEKGIQPLPANALGIRHIAFVVDDIEAIIARLKEKGMDVFSEVYTYGDSYKLCYCRGPEGIILDLAEPLQ